MLLVALLLPAALATQAPLSVQRELIIPTLGLSVGNAVIELRDGGFAVVGYADAGHATGTDVLLIRLDTNGDTLWTRTYGGDGEDWGWDVVETPDGGFYIVGYTNPSPNGLDDVLVMRLDGAGNVLWERTFDEGGRDLAWSAALAPSGGVVIAAQSEQGDRAERDAYVLHVGPTGDVVWRQIVHAPGDQRVFSIARTEDGAYVVTGTTAIDREATRDAYVVRVDAAGHVAWTRSFGDAPDDVGHGVIALGGGDVLVSGYGGTQSDGGSDVYLLRLDPEGNLRWWRHAGGPNDDRAMMSAPARNGGYVTVGYSVSDGVGDVIVMESGRDGNVQTSTVLERPGYDRGVMIFALADGRYIVTGMFGATQSSPGKFGILWVGRGSR
jgi:hypothetical protein